MDKLFLIGAIGAAYYLVKFKKIEFKPDKDKKKKKPTEDPVPFLESYESLVRLLGPKNANKIFQLDDKQLLDYLENERKRILKQPVRTLKEKLDHAYIKQMDFKELIKRKDLGIL